MSPNACTCSLTADTSIESANPKLMRALGTGGGGRVDAGIGEEEKEGEKEIFPHSLVYTSLFGAIRCLDWFHCFERDICDGDI